MAKSKYQPLKFKHVVFLESLGLDSSEWLYVRNTSESYTFYNIQKDREWNFRR